MAVSGERAYALLEKICFIRCMGTPEEKKAAQLICDEAASFGANSVKGPGPESVSASPA